jgi:hypothetical protein
LWSVVDVLGILDDTMIVNLIYTLLALTASLPESSAVSIKTYPYLYEVNGNRTASAPVIEHIAPISEKKRWNDHPDFLYNPQPGTYRVVEVCDLSLMLRCNHDLAKSSNPFYLPLQLPPTVLCALVWDMSTLYIPLRQVCEANKQTCGRNKLKDFVSLSLLCAQQIAVPEAGCTGLSTDQTFQTWRAKWGRHETYRGQPNHSIEKAGNQHRWDGH